MAFGGGIRVLWTLFLVFSILFIYNALLHLLELLGIEAILTNATLSFERNVTKIVTNLHQICLLSWTLLYYEHQN